MSKPTALRASRTTIVLNKVKTFFSKPHNVILLLLGIVLTFTTVAPIVAIVQDTFKIHAGTIDAHLTGQASGYTTVNYIDLFTSRMAKTNLWTPLLNTVLLAVGTCIVSILYGGLFAFLITRTDLAWRKYLSSIFIFPYIMPQWTLAVVWQNLFNSNAVTGTSNGLLAALFGINMPIWWCKGLFPSLMVLGLHYAPFAYILIGGIFRNMDANLEEAATILDTPKWKTMFRITLPMITPTAFLVFVLAVVLSALLSFFSTTALEGTGYVVAALVLAVFIGLGIVFDMIGVAVTAADPKPFHSMAAHKEKGAKAAIRLLQNANQVSSVCNDVVGDICGIVSGSTAAVIVTHLQRDLSTTSVLISIGATALISGITIGGKALGKTVAINQCTSVVYRVARIMHALHLSR